MLMLGENIGAIILMDTVDQQPKDMQVWRPGPPAIALVKLAQIPTPAHFPASNTSSSGQTHTGCPGAVDINPIHRGSAGPTGK